MEVTLLGFDAARWRWRSGGEAAAPPIPRSGAGRCVAASGGSRRDMQKIVARTKHRRARHMKLLNKRNVYDPVEEELVRRPHIMDISAPRDDRGDGSAPEEEGANARGFLREDATGAEGGESGEEIDDRVEEEEICGKRLSNGAAEAIDLEEICSSSASVNPAPKEDLEVQCDRNPYASLTVLVAGASGRTGRLVVEELSRRGAKVRALCRDLSKASPFGKMDNVAVVSGDICKYETLKKGLGDSNVVVCAIGMKAFALDLWSTYQTEYEGVVNLIAAAKNQGNIKKFIFVTSIGVSSIFQIIPLLWCKRQAEVALQRSGLDYTIVRPAGLREYAPANECVDMQPAGSLFFGGISRSKVAEVCVDAIVLPEASEKIVEIQGGNVCKSIQDSFSQI